MKIAFLFLIIDNPNFSDLWDKYFEGNENKYNLYIHPKYPDKHTWRPDNIIPVLKETAWGFITRAYLELFKEAYKNKENVMFITISESCVPVKKFSVFYKDCMKDTNLSWIKMMNIKTYDYEERIKKHISSIKSNIIIPDINKMIKHYARFCLKRNDIKKVIKADKDGKMEFFHTMHVGDEFFLSTIIPFNEGSFINKEITFDDWEYVRNLIKKINKQIKKKYELQEKFGHDLKQEILDLQALKQNIAKNPKTIVNVEEDLNQIKSKPVYFYRKFAINSNIRKHWLNIINQK